MLSDSGNLFIWGSLGVIFLWLLGLSLFLIRAVKHYNKLAVGIEGKNLTAVLEKILSDLKSQEDGAKNLREAIFQLKDEGVFHFQKVGFVRFNPFSDTGGDQSFVLALLDGEDSGMVITGLHGRENTRVYGKPVKCGKSLEYEFSKEEEEAIRKAIKSRTKR